MSTADTVYDLAVIGEGIAGLTCASRAAELGLSVATFEANVFGGLVMNIATLSGYGDGASGIDAAVALTESNAAQGVISIPAAVDAIAQDDDVFRVKAGGETYLAASVVIATGARMRALGVPGEDGLEHRGVSHCADCDGPLFRDQRVVVVGGGDAAFTQALTLAQFAESITILLRGRAPRARAEWVDAVNADPRIRIECDARVLEICGDDRVTGVRIATSFGEHMLECAGVFVYVGLAPNSEFVAGFIERAKDGTIETDEQCRTSRTGVRAIGAVRNGYSGLLADAEEEARRVAEHVAASPRRGAYPAEHAS